MIAVHSCRRAAIDTAEGASSGAGIARRNLPISKAIAA
jgi:hypothetical protein